MVLLSPKTLFRRLICYADIYSTTGRLYFLQNHSLISSPSLKFISTSSTERSFTVSYLITSCGFTLEQAQKASKIVQFETPEKPDSVRALFRNHGFSNTQISTIFRKDPRLFLKFDPKKILSPKLEFLSATGISKVDLAKALTAAPLVLQRSLTNHIIPSVNFFKNFIQSDSKFVTAIKQSPHILNWDLDTFIPIVEIVRQHGVPQSNIVYLMLGMSSFSMKPGQFIEVVEKVKQMGFSPLKIQFVIAVTAMVTMSKSTWQRKVEVFGKWGWSEENTLRAFKKCPWCMRTSEGKIVAVMDFFVNTMGWKSLQIAQHPNVILFSLEKRIMPRCFVFQALLSKGLIKKNIKVVTFLMCSETVFLQRYVYRYNEEAPQLLKLYQEKMGVKK